jgi:hypothetical protein
MVTRKKSRKKSPLANAPGRGGRVSTQAKAKFLTEYLRLGIVTSAAKIAGLPRTTCITFADAAEDDPAFVAARRALLTRGLDRVETMLIRGCEVASERVERDPVPDDNGCVNDVGHQYLRAISDAHRSLVQRRKTEHDISPENKNSGPVEINIRIAGEAENQPTDVTPS